jgi:hypothetical protein
MFLGQFKGLWLSKLKKTAFSFMIKKRGVYMFSMPDLHVWLMCAWAVLQERA